MRPLSLTCLTVSAGLALGAGGMPTFAVHVPTDRPLALAPEDLQRHREAEEEVVVIDLRPVDAFQRGHVARARSLPLHDLRRPQGEIPRADRVVLYAGTTEEAAAVDSALRDAGYRNVMVLAGGFRTWVGPGLPTQFAP